MYDERFARQYRYEPPPEFPLSLPFAGIVHHLSGPSRCVHTQTSQNRLVGCWCKDPSSHLRCASGGATHELAHMLDSLVRVSRRVDRNHFSIAQLTSMISEHIHTLEVSYHVPRSITPKSRKMPTWQEAQHNLAKG